MTNSDKRFLTAQVYSALAMFRAVLCQEVPIDSAETREQLLMELEAQREAFGMITDSWIK